MKDVPILTDTRNLIAKKKKIEISIASFLKHIEKEDIIIVDSNRIDKF